MWRDLVFQRMLSDYRGGLVRRPDEIRSRRNLRLKFCLFKNCIYIRTEIYLYGHVGRNG
ncbi:hypothetical protein BDA96_10G205400 [Sorghum bicolor]|uniref:Uncharacterized protein n=1 Tax=Sorghum bicolor TaxID=4558 RepID=A0A921U0W5_SORBI|nr:hypothetical protein BDA96_10G205400 [Sorghum bicolor]